MRIGKGEDDLDKHNMVERGWLEHDTEDGQPIARRGGAHSLSRAVRPQYRCDGGSIAHADGIAINETGQFAIDVYHSIHVESGRGIGRPPAAVVIFQRRRGRAVISVETDRDGRGWCRRHTLSCAAAASRDADRQEQKEQHRRRFCNE